MRKTREQILENVIDSFAEGYNRLDEEFRHLQQRSNQEVYSFLEKTVEDQGKRREYIADYMAKTGQDGGTEND